MPDRAGDNAAEWFKKAEEDVISVRAILKEHGAPSTACFLSEQIAEKYLKGMLVFHGKPFPKVHDLIELETLLVESTPDVNTLHEDLVRLNRYYIETRYPGDYPEFHLDEAQAAFTSALNVKEFSVRKTGIRI